MYQPGLVKTKVSKIKFLSFLDFNVHTVAGGTLGTRIRSRR